MKKKMFVSMLVILVAIVAAVGGTLAWFTDTAEITPNVFTAGTLRIKANDVFTHNFDQSPWNPGDCTDKAVSLELTGSKRAFVRMKITETWTKKYVVGSDGYVIKDPATGLPQELSPAVSVYYHNLNEQAPHVSWQGYDPDEWQNLNGWLYYVGMLYPNPIVDDGQKKIIGILSEVCFYETNDNGEKIIPGNEYQGAVYTIDADFEAIQVTHEAAFDEWKAGFHGGKWYPVVDEDDEDNTIFFNSVTQKWTLRLSSSDYLIWDAHDESNPNVKWFK